MTAYKSGDGYRLQLGDDTGIPQITADEKRLVRRYLERVVKDEAVFVELMAPGPDPKPRSAKPEGEDDDWWECPCCEHGCH